MPPLISDDTGSRRSPKKLIISKISARPGGIANISLWIGVIVKKDFTRATATAVYTQSLGSTRSQSRVRVKEVTECYVAVTECKVSLL
ncbi:hypothetical protein DY000_02013347 [Brassica cretica]|uniref:Uncharacterized protein n=1 Tax=Brassica cretica TaxID=69181 RepID=A0ABQ7CW39_BRACR|nr:hypothetical protein DY000_02013347 [Brassica cretica]